MSAKENELFTARLSSAAREMLRSESEKMGMTMTANLTMLIEGTLPNDQLKGQIAEIQKEIKEIKEMMRKK